MTIGIALLGAGIFAREEHLPAIAACDLLALVAVYSRSQATAEAFATVAAAVLGPDAPAPATYFDEPALAGRGLDDLLARADVAAVSLCLPIAQQAPAVRRALAAGKHVLSEKPIADTVAHAEALLTEYEAAPAAESPLWAVAENYRYHKSLDMAADALRALGGALVSFQLSTVKLTRPDGKYYNTPWRKTPTHPGGFLLDGGVHYVAALRQLLAAAPDTVWKAGGEAVATASSPAATTASAASHNKISKVAAVLAQLQPRLPPCDTVRAVAVTRGGASGLLTMTFGTEFGPTPAADLVAVTTTEGFVSWTPDGFTVLRRGTAPAKTVCAADPATFPPAEQSGVVREMAAFAQSIAAGGRAAADPRQTPVEALEDLRLMEALFRSGGDAGPLAVQEIA